MPATIKVQTTNLPVDENGKLVGDLLEVDEHEFRDLSLLGLIVKGAGDVNDQGKLKKAVAEEAGPETLALTGQQPTLTPPRTEGN